MDARRGYVPEDDRNFSPDALTTLKTASRHIRYLIGEEYDLKQATTFVGNHFQLSERQRLAIQRSISREEQLEGRAQRRVPLEALSGRDVWIDGFNQVITLEVMLSGGILLEGMDGAIRDLASLRGTYRIIEQTPPAIRLLYDGLEAAGVGRVGILLDRPVSNSGRLKSLLAELGEGRRFGVDISVLDEVDRTLHTKERVITSDAVILDACPSWVNLGAHLLARQGRRGIRVW